MACTICRTSWGSAQRKEEGLTYHRIPKRCDDLRKKWLDFCGARASGKVELMRLCSRHFEPKCFRKQAFCSLLRPGSVPTLRPPAEEPESSRVELERSQEVEETSYGCILEEESVLADEESYGSEEIMCEMSPDCYEHEQSTEENYGSGEIMVEMSPDNDENELSYQQKPESEQVIKEISVGHKPEESSQRKPESEQVIKEMTNSCIPEQSSQPSIEHETGDEEILVVCKPEPERLSRENELRPSSLSLSSMMSSSAMANFPQTSGENFNGTMKTLLQAIKFSSGLADTKPRMRVLIPIRPVVKKPCSSVIKERREIKRRLQWLESRREKNAARIKELVSVNKKLRTEVKRLKKVKPKSPSMEEICKHLRGRVSDTVIGLLCDQLRNSGKTPCGRRWSESTRDFALSVYMTSPAAYRKLGASMDLPSSRITAAAKAHSLLGSVPVQAEFCTLEQVEVFEQEGGSIPEQIECTVDSLLSHNT